MKKWIWFPIAVVVTAVLLVAVLAAIFAPPVRTALASTLGGNGFAANRPPWSRMWHGGGWGSGSSFRLPLSLQGLASIPADQRFAHFEGAQVNLEDQNNNPLTINIIPGKVTASSATSLTIAANSGGDKTFTLDNQTVIHAGAKAASTPAPTGTPAVATVLQSGDDVVVVTLNNSTTATAIIAGGTAGFGWPGH